MAVAHAEAGADIVAPSDMMDGRIKAMREALEVAGFTNTGILSYAVKHAGAYYGPFREAADSSPKFGDRRSYQMDPRNAREGLRDALLDLEEGADALMVKPALPNLDLIWRLREQTLCPIAAYHTSSEYSTVKAAARLGWVDEANLFREHLLAIRRAGADWIVTYAAREALQKHWI
jgi:porphobilinogen synthase